MAALHQKDQPKLKYIFVAGAPGSKWSSVVKNIYYSPDIDRSDYSDDRTYWHRASGQLELMHLGAYWDPGMEFDLPADISVLSRADLEHKFDQAFTGTGVRIVKSHVFMHNIGFIKHTWPDCPIVLVHRGDDACLGWWVKCGHFNITYPLYNKYYQNLDQMAVAIKRQNADMRAHWDLASFVYDNQGLCARLGIAPPPAEYQQNYADNKVRVKVL
jgi:hypothetical protein